MLINSFLYNSSEVTIKEEFNDDSEYAHLPPFKDQDSELEGQGKISQCKRRLRSYRMSSAEDTRQLRSYDESKQESGNLSRFVIGFDELKVQISYIRVIY